VIPYVTDTRNCLVIDPVTPWTEPEMASVQAALKVAIQARYQLEDGELIAEPLPSTSKRRRLLFFEAAEGGAGVLRRLVQDRQALAEVARIAIDLCHVDPDTNVDMGSQVDDGCEAACYRCLLSYRNQPDHALLDRHKAVARLQELAQAEVEPGTGGDDDGPGGGLTDGAESELEKRFIEWLTDGGFRLPDRGQLYIEAAQSRPDFIYEQAMVAVYVDGPPHEYPDRQARDKETNRRMNQLGWRVARFGHADDWAQITQAFKDAFGEGG
jgi:very-short-patch-repair endonuclease